MKVKLPPLVVVLLLALPGVLHAQPSRPNVLVVLSDDHSAAHLGAYGNADIKTPNLSDMLKQPNLYVFLEDRLELSFNQHEGGPYTVEIPYDRLRPLLRVDGPVPR